MSILESVFSIMVKSIFTALILICMLSSSFCQPGFNLLKNAGYEMNHFRDMIVVSDTLVGYGIGFDDPLNGEQGLVLVKLDTFGEILNSVIILDSLGDRLAISKTWGKIIATSDGGFAMTAATVFRRSAFLIKTDRDFNVEFIKEYPDTVNLSNFHYKLFEIPDGYMLYGSIQRPNFINRPFVRRVDKQGNMVWFKFFGTENITDTFVGGSPFRDSLFIFGGVKGGASLDLSSAFINVVNGDGEVKQAWNSGPHPEMGFLRELRVLENGSILIFGQYLVEVQGGIVQPALSLLNNDFDFEWIKHFGRVDKGQFQIQYWDMEPLPNNGFIGAGQSRIEVDGEPRQSGWLMKFTTEGDSIWSRYDFPDFPLDSLGDTFFGGVGVLSSGSIVAGGTATLWNDQAIWLVKVTTDGCLEVIDCGLVPITFRPEEEEGMVVYPNPANGEVSVKWEYQYDKASLRVYDLQGKIRIERAIENINKITLNTAHLSGGIYYIEIRDRLGHFAREKLLVIH